MTNRREFLKRTAAASAVAFSPSYIMGKKPVKPVTKTASSIEVIR